MFSSKKFIYKRAIMKKIIFTIGIYFILASCSGFQDAAQVLRNEKIKTTDEFLVKKKEPLVLPPDFNEIPEPGTILKNKTLEDKDRIKKILKSQEKINSDKNSSSTENSIIEKIRK